LLLTIIAVITAYGNSYAQAVPDTSLNQVIPQAARDNADSVRKYDSVVNITYATDTFAVSSDSMNIKFKPYIFEPNPKKAGLYSAILPGLGQVYNRQYWKVPIVFAIVGVTAYFFVDNLNAYQDYRKAYVSRISLDPSSGPDKYPNFTNDNLKQLQDQSKQYLDMTVLLGALGYTIQVLDAVASAHLKNFDISRDISMRMKPVLQNNGVGFGLVMNFK
jgi:hypothetical protein